MTLLLPAKVNAAGACEGDRPMTAALRFPCIVLAEEAPVMPEPEARITAAATGHGRLQASHADREQAIEMLKAAFVQDRLTKDEFDQRVSQAFTARTYAQIAALTADLPAGLIVAERLRKPARAQGRVSSNKAVTGGACLVVAIHVGMLGALLTGSGAVVLLVAMLAIIGTAVAIWALVVSP
jgi:hypothetical protein